MRNLRQILNGLVLAALSIIVHQFLSQQRAMEMTSFLMVLIGSVYYGFALLDKNKHARMIEMLVATFFVLLGIFGLWFSPWLLVIGLALHGLWDLLHHNKSRHLSKIPGWYVPFCSSYDFIMSVYIGYILL